MFASQEWDSTGIWDTAKILPVPFPWIYRLVICEFLCKTLGFLCLHFLILVLLKSAFYSSLCRYSSLMRFNFMSWWRFLDLLCWDLECPTVGTMFPSTYLESSSTLWHVSNSLLKRRAKVVHNFFSWFGCYRALARVGCGLVGRRKNVRFEHHGTRPHRHRYQLVKPRLWPLDFDQELYCLPHRSRWNDHGYVCGSSRYYRKLQGSCASTLIRFRIKFFLNSRETAIMI